jgi:hypothetical protein
MEKRKDTIWSLDLVFFFGINAPIYGWSMAQGGKAGDGQEPTREFLSW